ncbi:Hpt domain-containing protein [Xylophilus sp.]|uniref:Hpt domain-containing protein n=1 Tax=Xylophilus sp. TaxID=2653893 RepID=UPI0013BC59EB|nr:Hpt domain-containing protein [Xylophilus sp.]KAF1049772.1 MAG: Gliding motility regulatory protein [Xylophilus sp.]
MPISDAVHEPDAGAGQGGEHDLGPLAWVQGELRKSLDSAVKSLRRFVRDAESARGSELATLDASQLRVARQQLHQAGGALQMVGHESPALVLRAMETAVQRFVQRPELCTDAAADALERASFALVEYLEAVLAGKPVSAVALFPQYKDVQAIAGGDRVHPADLWPVERRLREPAAAACGEAVAPLTYGTPVRARLDQAVLQFIKSADPAAARAIAGMAAGLANGQSERAPRTFWKIAAGFFDGLAHGLIGPDVYAKRAASRVLLQYASLAKGELTIADRLLQDLLFFCAQAQPAAPGEALLLAAVRDAYGLARHRPVDYATPRFGRFDPQALAQARKRIGTATETWSALAGGDLAKLKPASDQFSLVGESLRRLQPQAAALADALDRAADSTLLSGEAPPPALAMEVATAVLYLQAAFKELGAGEEGVGERAAQLARRLDHVRAGGAAEPLESWMEELYRRVSDSQTLGSVVDELRATLAEAEKSLDEFFRHPGDRGLLVPVPDHLSRMRGVLSVLGLDQAQHAASRMRGTVDRLLAGEPAEEAARGQVFERLGNSIGALGFLIDMLSYQPTLARKLFVYDEDAGELRTLMGRQRPRAGDSREEAVFHVEERAALPAALSAVPEAQALVEPPAEPVELAPPPAAAPEPVDEDDLRDVFLEEAREVLGHGGEALDVLAAAPGDLSRQTTLRRAFHTLKGSSRMVGLHEFGEAAWALEQLLNAWLAEQKAVEPALLALSRASLGGFGRWVEAIAADDDADWKAAPFRAAADALRLRGEVVPLEIPGSIASRRQHDARSEDIPPTVSEVPPILASERPSDTPAAVEAEEVDFAAFAAALRETSFDVLQPAAEAPPADALAEPVFDRLLEDEARDTGFSDTDIAAFGLEPQEDGEADGTLPPPQEPALAPDLQFAWDSGAAPAAAQAAQAVAPDGGGDDVADAQPADESVTTDIADLAGLVAQEGSQELLQEPSLSAELQAAWDSFNIVADTPAVAQEQAAAQSAAHAQAGPAPEAAPAFEADAGAEPIEVAAAEARPEPAEPESGTAAAVFEAASSQEDLPPGPEPAAEPVFDAGPADEHTKVVGPLRIGIPLYNVYLAEADEWSRRLAGEVGEWALEVHRPLPDAAVALAHSLAGSSATVGFQALSNLARLLEHALQHVQLQGRGTPGQAGVFVDAAEDIRHLLHQFAAGFLKEPGARVLAELRAILATEVPAGGPPPVPAREAAERLRAVPRSSPAPAAPTLPPDAGLALAAAGAFDDIADVADAVDPDLFPIFEEEALELLPQLGGALRQWAARPDNASARSEALRNLHTLKGSARLAGALRLGELAHRLESAIELIGGGQHLQDADAAGLLGRFDALAATFDGLRAGAAVPAQAEASDALPAPASSDVPPAAPLAPLPAAAPAPRAAPGALVRVRAPLLDRLVNQAGEVMISRSRLEARLGQMRGSLADLSGNLDRLRQQLRDIEVQAESQMQSRLAQAQKEAAAFDPLEFDRFTRVQELTRMMAESVNDVATIQRNLQRSMEGAEDDLIAQGRQARALQRDLLRTRMVEFDSIAERLYAVVRQAAKEAGKQIRLDITGGTTELDRGVLDRMVPVFEHLLRNAVVQGIESPGSRAGAGKPAGGTIAIALHHEGNDVSVQLEDDGGGLDLARIRDKAIAQGLLEADAPALDGAAAAELVFRSGFSTASEVTGLAGRGIGMDVVRSEVQALGGRIETATQPGRFTRFNLVLPLTTAVTQVVLLRAGPLSFGVPAGLVEIVRRVPVDALEAAYRSGVLDDDGIDGDTLPFHWAGALLESTPRSTDAAGGRTRPVVILRSAAQRIALHVDEVLGNQEVVVKNLGPQLARLPGLAGMSMLPSGAVVLIYNPVALATVYGDQARERTAAALAAPAQAEAPAAAAADGAPRVPLVLVVDDSITVRRVTQRLLLRAGYRVALAADGLQALERLQEERPTLVLSDIEMPRMDGFDLVRNIRADAALADLPVVMITSRIAAKHREHALSLGVNHYLGKPYSEEELLGLVRRYASEQVEGAEAAAG